MIGSWLSILALAGWLILALSAYRARDVDLRKTLILAAVWGGLFLVAALAFS